MTCTCLYYVLIWFCVARKTPRYQSRPVGDCQDRSLEHTVIQRELGLLGFKKRNLRVGLTAV